MGPSATSAALPRIAELPLIRRGHSRWLVRAPGRRGVLSAEEVAYALSARRDELRAGVHRRYDARFLSVQARDEVLDEAIAVVATATRPIEDEKHLEGAFWRTVKLLIAERRAGRHELRVGSQRRVDFDPVERELADHNEPFDFAEARDRHSRANDLVAQLDPLERRVFSVMAVYGIGAKAAANALAEPLNIVLAAARGAERKLDQVAAIAAAGRMCEYRLAAIREHAAGTAAEPAERAARAHLAACGSCRDEYARLVREMHGREFKRAASAAFLPAPAMLLGRHGLHRWIERVTALIPSGRAPGGTVSAERAGVLLGGGAGVKVAAGAVTAALIVSGAGASAIHSLAGSGHATHRRAASAATHSPQASSGRRSTLSQTSTASSGAVSRDRVTDRPGRARVRAARTRAPGRGLGYLSVGGSPAAGSSPTASEALVGTSSSSSARSAEAAPPSGGGTNLGYLGR